MTPLLAGAPQAVIREFSQQRAQRGRYVSAASAAASAYAVSRSLRANSSDSAHLSRSASTPTSTTTATFAFWAKRSSIPSSAASGQTIFGGHPTRNCTIEFDDGGYDKLNSFRIVDESSSPGTYVAQLATDQVFRDPNAWYHIVLALDSTQSTSTNRIKMYVNGQQVTTFTGAQYYPSQDQPFSCLVSSAKYIGSRFGSDQFFNGYLADIHFIDGYAYDPSYFGETNATTGVWDPKTYSGSYGSNGFHLDFADNSSTTSGSNTGIGKDTSGNGNYWNSSGLSVTAGAGNDSLIDTPTNGTASTGGDAGGVTVGNYAVLNPLNRNTNAAAPTNGNLDYPYSFGTAAWLSIAATIGVTSGKYYWEITPTVVGGNGVLIGIANQNYNFAVAGSSTIYVGHTSNSWGYYSNDGKIYTIASGTSYGNTFTANNVIGVALDMDNGKCWFSKNGTWQNSGSPTGGTNAGVTGLSGSTIFPAVALGDATPNTALTANFGQRSFSYAAPAGFKSLCTANLPTPTIAKGSDYFDVKLYTGNGSTQTISGLNFSPDLVWAKSRSAATNHGLIDTVRGRSSILISELTVAEQISPAGADLASFDANGFSLGSNNAIALNTSSQTYAAWCWDAGTSTVTNTQGSITSSVRANASAGFSIVTIDSATGSSSATIGHGLGVTPALIIQKARTTTYSWNTYFNNNGTWIHFALNSTDGSYGTATTASMGVTPTSTTISLGSNFAGSNDYVYYCFAPVDGYSAMGSYVGNGSSDGPMVYTGHRSRWIMIKKSSNTGSWIIWDSARDTYNYFQYKLAANLSSAENDPATIGYAYQEMLDACSNGFKLRSTNQFTNSNGETYVWVSFAESPFAYARAR